MPEGRPFNAQFHPVAHGDFVFGGNQHPKPIDIHYTALAGAWRSPLKSSVADPQLKRKANFGAPFDHKFFTEQDCDREQFSIKCD